LAGRRRRTRSCPRRSSSRTILGSRLRAPGDLFDGGEIDQLLILNILALTDKETAEMAATDPRAREILRRTEALTAEQLMALRGRIRQLGTAR